MTFIVPAPGENFDQGRINTLFQGTGDVAIRRRQVREGDAVPAIEAIREWRSERYEITRWRQYVNGSYTTTILDHRGWVAPFKSIAWNAGSVTYPSGVVPTLVSQAYSYGGSYGTTTVLGRNLQVVVPIGSTRLGIGHTVQGNSVLAKVTINGDATLANLLPTAQDLVTRGTAASTILVANGGVFNPTDRVLDTYHGSNVNGTVGGTDSYFGFHTAIADDLDPMVSYTVLVEHTNLKNLAASGTATLTVERFTYGDDTMTRDTAGVELLDLHRALFNIIPDTEYALDVQPAGASSSTLIGGQAHGYENATNSAITYTLDGVTVPTSGTAGAAGNLNTNAPTVLASAWNWGAEAVITRPSTLYHPTLAAGATPWATSSTTFTVTYEGLRFKPTITLALNAVFDEHYLTMNSLDGYRFTAGWWYEDLDPSLFTARDDSITYKTAQGAMFLDPDGVQAANWELNAPADLGILSAAPSISTGAPNSDIVKGYRRSPAVSLLAGDILTTESLMRLSLEADEVTLPLFVSSREQLEFDGLALNDGSTFMLTAADFTPPKQRQEWIGAADSEHQVLVRDPLHENRTITATIRVVQTTTMDAALDGVARIVDRLQAASKDPDGVQLTWSPANSSLAVTFDVLAGEVTGLPVDWESGWLARSPEITVTMTAKPYWYATTEIATDLIEAATPFTTFEIENAYGDIPALGRLVITDTQGQARRHLEWGLEGPLTYDPDTELLIDSDDMLVGTGYIGSQETGTGYDPNGSGSTNILAATVTPIPAALCGLGDLTHTGVFRVKARIQSSTEYAASLRLSWKVGDGPTVSNPWVTPRFAAAWEEHDLGTVTIPAATSGQQRWTAQIDVQQRHSSPLDLASLSSIRLDYVILIPAIDGYGKARADFTYRTGATSLYDDFIIFGAPGLDTQTATIGGTWASSGTGADFVPAGTTGISRAIVGARLARLGTSVLFDSEATVRLKWSPVGAGTHTTGPIARYVDSSNYARATFDTSGNLSIVRVVAGTGTTVATRNLGTGYTDGSVLDVRLIVYGSGRAIAQLVRDGVVLGQVIGSDTSLATGGTLDDGKLGIYDTSTATTMGALIYKFFAGAPAAEPLVINASRTFTINGSGVWRQDSTGTINGDPASYLGSRFVVPVGTSRALVKGRRDDIDTSTDTTVTDLTRVQAFFQPRGLVVPR